MDLSEGLSEPGDLSEVVVGWISRLRKLYSRYLCLLMLPPSLTRTLSTMAKIQAQPFRLALCQLAPSTANKQENIATAQRAVKAAAASTPKPDLIVLPEIWNSPYAVPSFREYAEPIPAVGGKDEGEGETIKAMREMAREAGVWLIGGEASA